jgi:hypothetical protein
VFFGVFEVFLRGFFGIFGDILLCVQAIVFLWVLKMG